MQMDGKVECVALIQFEIEIENVFDDCAIKCLGFTYVDVYMHNGNGKLGMTCVFVIVPL